jgi:hypothetical protein
MADFRSKSARARRRGFPPTPIRHVISSIVSDAEARRAAGSPLPIRDPVSRAAATSCRRQTRPTIEGSGAVLHPDFGGDAKRVLKALRRSLAIA